MKYQYYIKRIVAAVIDVLIISLIMFIYIKIRNGSYSLEEENVPSYIFIPFFYLYFIIQEALFKTTIGKKIFSLSVKTDGKYFFVRVFFRNILNLLELVIPLVYLIPILITGLTGQKKPKKIGDLICGTYVE